MEELENHLRYMCPHVIIACPECEDEYTRTEFKEHDCYQNALAIPDEKEMEIERLKKEVEELK